MAQLIPWPVLASMLILQLDLVPSLDPKCLLTSSETFIDHQLEIHRREHGFQRKVKWCLTPGSSGNGIPSAGLGIWVLDCLFHHPSSDTIPNVIFTKILPWPRSPAAQQDALLCHVAES